MNQAKLEIQELIRKARNGNREALGELLDRHRAYLRVIAQRHVKGRLAARLDASDLIQQTCLSVYRNFCTFGGHEVGEFIAWLRKVHERNIQNAIRDHVYAQKRAVGREQQPSAGSPAPQEVHAADQTTASQRAMRGEQAVELAETLEKLPPNQREAVRLRHLEGWSLAQISEQMGRSEVATVGLIKRGMKKMRELLKDSS